MTPAGGLVSLEMQAFVPDVDDAIIPRWIARLNGLGMRCEVDPAFSFKDQWASHPPGRPPSSGSICRARRPSPRPSRSSRPDCSGPGAGDLYCVGTCCLQTEGDRPCESSTIFDRRVADSYTRRMVFTGAELLAAPVRSSASVMTLTATSARLRESIRSSTAVLCFSA